MNRRVESLEELEGLPKGAVIKSRFDDVYQRGAEGWLKAGLSGVRWTSRQLIPTGPYDVLWAGQEPKMCPCGCGETYEEAVGGLILEYGLDRVVAEQLLWKAAEVVLEQNAGGRSDGV